jgi:putative restriction endonuclease
MARAVPDLLDHCLGLTDADARAQWRQIAARDWQPRQERYLPVELLLCFGLFRLFNPHGYGGANLHRLPAEVHALARALKRPVGSLTNKMLNLEGFRANGARVETELFLHLGRDPERFAALYVLTIQAARLEGFGQHDVADFLGWLDLAPEPILLGQDEIGARELDLALDGAAADLRAMEQAYGFDGLETTRVVEQRVRLRQHCFASQVLAQYRHHCAFCGLDASTLRGHRLLVASHVKPWAASTSRERLDPRNGVSACTIHDSAFDTGLLTIQRDLTIRRAPALVRLLASNTAPGPAPPSPTNDDAHAHTDANALRSSLAGAPGHPPPDAIVRQAAPTDVVIDPATRAMAAAISLFGPGTLAARLLVPDGVSGPAPTFLDYHRRLIFRA